MDYDAIKQEMDRTGLDYETARQIVEQRNRPDSGNGRMERIGPSDLALWKGLNPSEPTSSPPDAPPLYKRLQALKQARSSPPPTSPLSKPKPLPNSAPPSSDVVEHARPEPRCPRCRDAGYLVADARIGEPDFGKLLPCTCLQEAQRQRAQQQRQSRATVLLARLQGELGHLASCTFDAFDPTRPDASEPLPVLFKALAKARAYADSPAGWLYLWGDRGMGKSHLAIAVAQAAAAAGVPTLYASAPRQLDFVKDGFRDRSASERLEALIEVELLLLDDLGTEQATEWAAATLFALLDERYRHDRPTVFTSNVHPDMLARRSKDDTINAHYERIADRIMGQCGDGLCIEVRGPSYRRRRV